MSATVEMALWLEQHLDPPNPPARLLVDFAQAFPAVTMEEFVAALALVIRAAKDRIEGVKAEQAELRLIIGRREQGEG